MYKTQNGWTKAKMIERIKQRNNGKRSVRPASRPHAEVCMYRAPDGNRCAVGCFIEDNIYEADMEGCSAYDFIGIKFPLSKRGMRSLQCAHDEAGLTDNIHEVLEAWINKNVKDGE